MKHLVIQCWARRIHKRDWIVSIMDMNGNHLAHYEGDDDDGIAEDIERDYGDILIGSYLGEKRIDYWGTHEQPK